MAGVTGPIGPLTIGGRRHIGAALEKRLMPRFMSPRRNARRSSRAPFVACSPMRSSWRSTTPAGHPVRLAGTRLCALFGREIKGELFLDFWASSSADHGRSCVDSFRRMHRHGRGGHGQNEAGEVVELELLLLPLGVRRPSFARAIGVLAPLKVPAWLGATPIGPLTLGGRRHIGAEFEKRLMPRFMAPRGRRGFKVYDGGGRSISAQSDDGPSAA